MNKKKLYASDYDQSRFFKAVDLKHNLMLTIKNVTEEEMIDGEKKLVVWFDEDKRGLVLNKINNRTIREEYGDDTDDWAGGMVVLFTTTAPNPQGKMGPAIRVRIPLPKEKGPKSASPPPRGKGPGSAKSRKKVTKKAA